jgi:membrane protease subunit (stomatin/prohibitin family)
MTLAQFLGKQFIDVIQWNEPGPGILSWRYPMLDQEIQNGGKLTVRESEMALFVDQGKIADVFGPGMYTLNTQNLPILTDLKNWDKDFESPFKSDVYFFSTHQEIDQKWGTATPITLRDKEFGAIRVRSYGIYSFRIADPRLFFTQVSGTRETYYVADLEDQLKNTIVARMTDIFATSGLSYLDMTANETALSAKVLDGIKPTFAALGLDLTQFVVENISLPDELQKSLDQRIGMNMVGDLDKYSQFAAAQAMNTAAANTGGAAGLGAGIGAGAAIGQVMSASLHAPPASAAPSVGVAAAGTLRGRSSASLAGTRFRGARTSARTAGRRNELPFVRCSDACSARHAEVRLLRKRGGSRDRHQRREGAGRVTRWAAVPDLQPHSDAGDAGRFAAALLHEVPRHAGGDDGVSEPHRCGSHAERSGCGSARRGE